MTQPTAQRPQRNTLVELLVTLVIPSLILMKLSGPDEMGAVGGLVVALAFPLAWGIYDLVTARRFSALAVLGIVSIVLTGGIGLLELDPQWLAVKEAAVPGVIGLVVAASGWTRTPLVRVLLLNPALVDVDRIRERLAQRRNEAAFDQRVRRATWMLAGAFFFSSAMNYFLAAWIVTSPAGTAAFNEELGRLTLLSYPMIALPSMLIMGAVLYYLARATQTLAGLKLTDAFKR